MLLVGAGCQRGPWETVHPDGADPAGLRRQTIPVRLTAVPDTSPGQARPVAGAPVGWLYDPYFGYVRYALATFPEVPTTQPIVQDTTAFDSAVIEIALRSGSGVEGPGMPDSLRFTVYALTEEVPPDSSFPLQKRWQKADRWGSRRVAYHTELGGFLIPVDAAVGRRLFRAYYERDSASDTWLHNILKGLYIEVDSPTSLPAAPSGWLVHMRFNGGTPSGIRIYFSDSLSLFFPFDRTRSYPAWQYQWQNEPIAAVMAGNDATPLWLAPGGTRLRIHFPDLKDHLSTDPHRITAHQATLHLPFRNEKALYTLLMPPRLTLTNKSGQPLPELASPALSFRLQANEALFSIPLYFHDSLLGGGSHVLFINLPSLDEAAPARIRWEDTAGKGPRLEITYSEN